MTQTRQDARSAVAAEWASCAPQTPREVADFYRGSQMLAAELDAWHREDEIRQNWTKTIVSVAQQIEAKLAVDIGCGLGQDLQALADAGIPQLVGVEPNEKMRATIGEPISVVPDVDMAPVETADLIVMIDVLEHMPDPEAFVTRIAERARAGGERPGAVLIETTATHDIANPLHLPSTRGWHPGRALERAGFRLINTDGLIRVWQRASTQPDHRTTVMLCAYRGVAVQTLSSILGLVGMSTLVMEENGRRLHQLNRPETPWRVDIQYSDGLISRARSKAVTRWWRETAEDVLLMVDDDIIFTPDDAQKLLEGCRRTRGIVVAAYPVRDGGHVAVRGKGDVHGEASFGPGLPLEELEYGSTGFMAIHRDVVDAMIPTLTLCHEATWWSFWPMFEPLVEPGAGQQLYLSEDWAFCARARDLGHKTYLDPTIVLGHLGLIEVNVRNMSIVHRATKVR